MDQQQMFKQMMEFQKTTFDNSFGAMSKLQEQGETMVKTFVDQAPWLPEDGKKAIKDWINAYQSGRENFKKNVDASYQKVQEFFASFEKKSE
jgi:polyhydroxyalkanoate synthesis regulator phasin